VNNTFFQYYSLLITIVCALVFIAVSYMTEAPSYDKISGLTYSTMTAEDRLQTRASWKAKDVFASVLVLALILAAYLYFQG
jgi:SSS family solute:Na+ symporter